MRLKLIYKYSFVVILLYLFTACTNRMEESFDGSGQGEGQEVSVNIMPKLAIGDENKVSQLRVIIFSTRTSDPYAPKILVSNQLIDTNEDYTAITYIGYNDIYVIGNEPVDLSGIKRPEELKTIRMNTENNLNASKFVFFRQLLNVNVRSKNEVYPEGESVPVRKLEIKLQRVVAKLSVKFDLSKEIYENGNPTGEYVNFESMELLRIPKYCYLVSGKYRIEDGFLNNRTFSLQNSSTEPNHFTWSSGEVYLPEYLPEDGNYRMVLRITGTSRGITRIYTLPVGDAMNSVDSHSNDWNITRNRHYILNIKAVTGYGEESLEMKANVAGWSEINVPIDVTGASFLAVNKKTVEVRSFRFFTYVRFACNEPVEVNLPDGIEFGNQLQMKIEYDDTTKKSGRVGFKRGNWNTGNSITYVTTLKSGSAAVKLNLKLYKTEIAFLGMHLVTWAEAMGYWGEANYVRTGIYNDEFYKRATRETGCRAYYPKEEGVNEDDPIKGKGCWRLATINENISINTAPAWCIEEHDTYGSNMAYISGGAGLIHDNKTQTYRYHCTLDIRPPELSDFIVSSEDIPNVSKEEASSKCANLSGGGWRLPTGKEMKYVFQNAGTNGLPNNFFSNSYWGKNNEDNTFIVATMSNPDGSGTDDELRNKRHTVRCVKLRYPSL
ncbi:hypothetical protein [uncultured Bacteroides sp.]|uniref:hypothetical protein n=1 Tax=uncultured Bacteroides sp. TaxID=162156 RepID=UPI0025F58704|nr:hypothetical protein [uncultured Bacteroides sp.]